MATLCNAYCEYAYNCPNAVARDASGRWYITPGHSGYNSPANNRLGYATQNRALAAIRSYYEKGRGATALPPTRPLIISLEDAARVRAE